MSLMHTWESLRFRDIWAVPGSRLPSEHWFATAGAAYLILIGTDEKKLRNVESAVKSLSQSTRVSIHAADVTEAAAVKAIADAVGTWDSILHCAGYMNKPALALAADLDDYWKAFEVSPQL